jgi:catechol 2,3-dioxygenase-like lactoylglutathione lyase family enzyme
MDLPTVSGQITFLYTNNLSATADFYENTVGLELALDQRACRIYKTAPAAFLGFCHREEISKDHQDIIITLVTPEVDLWHKLFIQRGVSIEKPPALNPKFQIYHFFFRDPNGYLIEVQEFLDPAWKT